MAQAGFTPISLYYSTTAAAVPTAGNLTNGELAINITDGKLFYKDNSAAVQVIGWKTVPVSAGGTGLTATPTNGQLAIGNGSGYTLANITAGSGISVTNGSGSITIAATNAGTVTSVTASSPLASSGGATPNISLTGTVAIANGGTGQTTASAAFNALSPITSTGDLIIGNGVNSATRLAIGANGTVLQSNGTTATWASFTSGASLSNDTSTASNLYPMFAAATSGTPTTVYTSNAKLLYKPSTGEFQASELIASNGLILNNTTVSASYTVPTGSNAMSVGPITVASGQSVTVSSGQRWLVL